MTLPKLSKQLTVKVPEPASPAPEPIQTEHTIMPDTTVTSAVNGGLVIEEFTHGIRFGTDALLLADFIGTFASAAELGSGSGVVSLLLLSAGAGKRVTGVEFDAASAELSEKNAAANGLSDRFTCVREDVLNIRSVLPHASFACVFSNPPYLKNDTGKRNADPAKFAAFHETTAVIGDFVSSAAYLLKSGGNLHMVYRPENLSKLLFAMETSGIRPKRLRIVCPSYDKPPCLVLVTGKKDARDGMRIDPPFFIYADGTHEKFSPGMESVFGRFACR